MRGQHRKITARLIEQEQVYNQRLAEYFANAYKERKMKK